VRSRNERRHNEWLRLSGRNTGAGKEVPDSQYRRDVCRGRCGGVGGGSRARTRRRRIRAVCDVAEQLKAGKFLRNLLQGSKETEPLLKVLVNAGQYKKDLEPIVEQAPERGVARRVKGLGSFLYKMFEDSGIRTGKGRSKGQLVGVVVALVLGALVWLLAMSSGRATPGLFVYPSAVLGLVCGIVGYWLGGLAGGAEAVFDLVAMSVALTAACATALPKQQDKLCANFDQHLEWYDAAKASQDR